MAGKIDRTGDGTSAYSGRGKIISVLTVLILLVLGTGAISYYYFDIPPIFMIGEQNSDTSEADPAQENEVGPLVEIQEFIVNIISEENNHYLKISMTLEMSDEKARNEAEKRMAQIRDTVLLQLSNKTFEELYDLQGKKLLKAELLNRINDLLTAGMATSIYFTDFVVQ